MKHPFYYTWEEIMRHFPDRDERKEFLRCQRDYFKYGRGDDQDLSSPELVEVIDCDTGERL